MIRSAVKEDAKRLLEIYAYYVKNTAVTFEIDVPLPDEFEKRVTGILENYPWLVLEEDGVIQGYAYARAFVGRAAYRYSCEVSIYLDHGSKGRGYGRLLYEALEKELRKRGICNLYACIANPETEDEYLTRNSEQFHQHLGFARAGTFHQCGFKFGRWYNMIWMEKLIGDHDRS